MLSDTDAACVAASVAVCLRNRIAGGPKKGTDEHHNTIHRNRMRDVRLNEENVCRIFLRLDGPII
jgi:hypothetical protein